MKRVLLILIFLSSIAYGENCIRYNRSDYRHWIDADHDCQSTRNEVLIEESLIPVTFKPGSNCVVVAGKWKGLYTGQIFTNPSKLDADHVVPLMEAHESGAWAWSKEKKKRYANYLEDKNHIIAVSLHANRSKQQRDPAEWIPTNRSFQKQYARIWIKIKNDWGLTADSEELWALKRILQGESVTYPKEAPEYNCSGNPFDPPDSVVKSATRGDIVKKSKSGICHDNKSRWYDRTKRFTPYDSVRGCLDSGGRLPQK